MCYLNSYGKDFKGGLFHFQDGEPATLVPMAGVRATLVMMINCFVFCHFCFTHFFCFYQDVAIYTADSCNIHAVDEVNHFFCDS